MNRLIRIIFSALACLIIFSSIAFCHSGGLDGNGGHYNRKTGEYHLHRKTAESYHKPNIAPKSYDNAYSPNKTTNFPQKLQPKEDNTKWWFGFGGVGVGYVVFRYFNKK